MKPLAQNTLIQNRYLIVQLIGKGGMGEVYLAVDQRLGSAIALKRTYFAGDETLGNAFEREARVLARLRHPVLPKVSDHFSEGEEQYLVMEHISGDDLMKRIELNQKPFPLSWVMFWADQLLDSLSYLHSHEPPIIHRDIKPQNLKLTDENHIVLLDFGLSKTSTGNTNLASGTGSTGSVVGYTPHYAPMEQIRGIGTSARSDIYSLSATLYQLMTNQVPADALSRADALLNGMPDPIKPPSEFNPEVPYGVSDVLLKGMEVSQEKRFSTAREMQKALRKAFSEMQSAMSAKTEVFNAASLQTNGVASSTAEPNFDATEVMDPAALHASPEISGSSGGHTSQPQEIAQPAVPPVDLNATMAYDPAVPDTGGVKQSDVRTEVFIAGTNSFPTPPASEPAAPSPEASYGGNDFAPTTDYSGFGEVSPGVVTPDTDSYSPQSTEPIISYDSGSGSDAYADSPSVSDGDAQPFETDNRDSVGMAAAAGVASAAPVTAKPAKEKKKGSTGKIVLILGGLFLFLAAVLGIGAGGVYYYSNYAAVEATPEPSPIPTIEPTPEPTVDNTLVTDTNSNSNTDANSSLDSNSNTEPSPTPPVFIDSTPETRPDTPRPDQRPTRAPSTPKPGQQKTPPRTTPTKRPGGGAPDILQ